MPLLLAIPFLEVIAAFLIIGFIVVGRPFADALSKWVDATVQGATFGLVGVTGAGKWLAQWLSHTLVERTSGTIILGARWLGGIAMWVEVVVGNALAWPYWLLRLQEWLIFDEIPRLVKAIPHAATSVVHSVTQRVVRVERTVVKFPKLSRAQARALIASALSTVLFPYLPALRWLKAHVHALEAVLPGAISIPRGWTPTAIRRWLRSYLNRWTLTTAFAGAIAVALGRLGLGWVRCNNVKRIGRNLCGLSPRAISDLLGLLADWLILTNVCRVFSLMEDGLGVVQPAVTAFITDVETWACYGDNEHPPRLPEPVLNLPALVPISLSAEV